MNILRCDKSMRCILIAMLAVLSSSIGHRVQIHLEDGYRFSCITIGDPDV